MIASNDVILKLSTESLGIGQILFIRGCFAAAFFMLIIRLTGKPMINSGSVDRWSVLRACCECLATFCFIISLSALPIAIASTLTWTSPILLTIVSAVFLKERVSIGRWLAVFVGFVGVMFVTNPFGDSFSPIMVLPLVAACFVVMRDLLTKRVSNEIHSVYVVLITLALVAVVGGLTSGLNWQPVKFNHITWLSLSACLLSTGFFCQIKAVRMGELSYIAPFLFTSILVAVMWGYLVWGDIPSATMIVGIALIIIAGIYMLSGQVMTKRRLRTMQPH